MQNNTFMGELIYEKFDLKMDDNKKYPKIRDVTDLPVLALDKYKTE
jgi:hypothetical protein